MKYFGQVLKELRQERNLTQDQLGAIFNVSRNAVYGWENDKQEPSLDTLKSIAVYFGVTTDYLLGLTEV